MNTEPKASKIVSVQIAFGQDDPSTLDEITASIKDVLAQLDPKRVTVMDEYWLVNGERVTRTQLARAAATPVASTTDDEPGLDYDEAMDKLRAAERGEGPSPIVKLTGPKSLETAVAARTCIGGCGTVCTKDNADQNDDGSWKCHQCQEAA